MSSSSKRWLLLILGVGAIVASVGLLHIGTLRLGGSPRLLIESNRSGELEVSAYVYSEVGDIADFLDDESGSYGRTALGFAVASGGSDLPASPLGETGRELSATPSR